MLHTCVTCEKESDTADTKTDSYWTDNGDRVVYHVCPECGKAMEGTDLAEGIRPYDE